MAHTADNQHTDDKPDEPSSDPGRICFQPALTRVRNSAVPAVMQRELERSRTVVDGRRTDDGDSCKLVAIQEVSGVWALYPHGVQKFGVRLSKANADVLVQAILKGVQ
jgi:hypothetical protein